MNLLQLIQQVCDELGLQRPPQIIGSVDPQVRQFLALLTRLGADICRQFDWQQLNKEHILQTVAYTRAGTLVEGSNVVTGIPSTTGLTTQFNAFADGLNPFSQIESVDGPNQVTLNMPATASGTVDIQWAQVEYNLPSDWKKQIPQTEWDRVNRWPLLGPQSPQTWQSFKSGIVYNGPRERFRILQNAIAISPPPPSGLIFAFEYISNAWIRSASGAPQTQFLADTDTMVFDDPLLVTGLKVQWKAAKGLDATWDLAEFRGLMDANKSQNKSAPTLSMSPTYGTVLLSANNIQDGNFPGPL